MEDLAPETKVKIYHLILSRYKEHIEKHERSSLSELRQMITPYNDFIKSLRDKIIEDLQPYSYEKHFFSAVQKVTEYIRSIKNIKLDIVFWMSFEELDSLKAGPLIDQAIFLTSLLRSLGSNDTKVYISFLGKIYVGFSWNNTHYLINPESGSLLSGSDAENAFVEDHLRYVFNDLSFESLEE